MITFKDTDIREALRRNDGARTSIISCRNYFKITFSKELINS